MSFSNTIGSNTFDVLACLGIPWLIETIRLCYVAEPGMNYIFIHSGGLEYSAILLIASLIVMYVVIALNNFMIDRKVGILCLLLYTVFIVFACLLELNAFFPVNLPPC